MSPIQCACRFEWRPMPDFSGAAPKQLEECGFHAEQRRKLEEWSQQVRLIIRGIDGQARRLTKDDAGEEIITGYQLNTGLWHRLLGLLAQCPAKEYAAPSTGTAGKESK